MQLWTGFCVFFFIGSQAAVSMYFLFRENKVPSSEAEAGRPAQQESGSKPGDWAGTQDFCIPCPSGTQRAQDSSFPTPLLAQEKQDLLILHPVG